MSMSLIEMLRNHYTDNDYHTHVSMIQPRGKFQFNRNYINDLFKVYRSYKNPKGLAEVNNGQYMPIICDIDLFVRDSEIRNLYTINEVKEVIQVYNDVILSSIPDISQEDLLCCFLSKDPYIVKDKMKNGFHLHYPKIFVSPRKFETVLLPKIENLINERNILQEFRGCNDKSVMRVPWLMYSSVKSEEFQPYLLNTIFNHELQEQLISEAFSDYKIYNEKEKRINITGKIQQYLPNIFSIHNFGRNIYCREIKEDVIVRNPQQPASENDDDICTENIPELSDIQRELIDTVYIPNIKKEYIEDTKKWFVMVNLLKYLCVEDEKIHEVSQRTTLNNYDEASLTHLLDRFDYNKYLSKNLDKNGKQKTLDDLINNLKRMCILSKKDLQRPIEEVNDNINQLLSDTDGFIGGTHKEIADLWVSMFGNEYKITDLTGSGFKWDQTLKLWLRVETSLFIDISRLIDHIESCLIPLNEQFKNNNSDIIKTRVKQLNKILNNIKMVGFCKSVWEIIYNTIFDRSFLNIVNKNKCEMPYKGGYLINLKTSEIRQRTKNDFWSFEIDYDYIEDISLGEQYINTLFDEDEMRVFIKNLLGYMVTGEVSQRKGYFFIGSGRNGKSEFINIISKVFKQFSATLSKGVIVKNQSHHSDINKPNPEVQPLINSRIAFTCEMESEEKIDENKFKNITGSDSLYYRPMFMRGDPIQFTTQSKLVCITNNLPEFSCDQAMKDRICIIPFDKRFEGNKEEKEYFESLSTQIFLNSFFSMCIKYSIMYYNTGITYPDRVLNYTKDVFKSKDLFTQFIDGSCVLGNTKDHTVNADIFYNEYNNFLNSNDKRSETKEMIGKNLKTLKNVTKKQVREGDKKPYFLIGIRFKTDQERNDE